MSKDKKNKDQDLLDILKNFTTDKEAGDRWKNVLTFNSVSGEAKVEKITNRIRTLAKLHTIKGADRDAEIYEKIADNLNGKKMLTATDLHNAIHDALYGDGYSEYALKLLNQLNQQHRDRLGHEAETAVSFYGPAKRSAERLIEKDPSHEDLLNKILRNGNLSEKDFSKIEDLIKNEKLASVYGSVMMAKKLTSDYVNQHMPSPEDILQEALTELRDTEDRVHTLACNATLDAGWNKITDHIRKNAGNEGRT